MNKRVLQLVGFLAPMFVIYLLGVFAAWDINPGAWSVDGRVIAAMGMGLVTPIGIGIAVALE